VDAVKSGFQISSDLMETLAANGQDGFYLDANRSDVMQQLDHHWRYSNVVMLQGAKGVGKSALVQHFQRQLDFDVTAVYIDARALSGGEDIINFMLDTLGLDGGPVKTRKEKIEKVLQHAELEADLGQYVLLIIDHFELLSEGTQRFFMQIAVKTASQLRQIFVVQDDYATQTRVAESKDIPMLQLLPLQQHKVIHHLNDRLQQFGIEIHDLINAPKLEQLITNTHGDLNKLNNLVMQLLAVKELQDSKTKRALSPIHIGGIVVAVIALTALIYFGFVDEPQPSTKAGSTVSVDVPITFVEEVTPKTSEATSMAPVEDELPTPDLISAPTADTPIQQVDSEIIDEVQEMSQSIAEMANEMSPFVEEGVSESSQQSHSQAALPVTIQLMGVHEPATLQQLVAKYPQEPLQIIKTLRNSKPWYVLVYGEYTDKTAARAVLSLIPRELQSAQPWVRNREEI